MFSIHGKRRQLFASIYVAVALIVFTLAMAMKVDIAYATADEADSATIEVVLPTEDAEDAIPSNPEATEKSKDSKAETATNNSDDTILPDSNDSTAESSSASEANKAESTDESPNTTNDESTEACDDISSETTEPTDQIDQAEVNLTEDPAGNDSDIPVMEPVQATDLQNDTTDTTILEDSLDTLNTTAGSAINATKATKTSSTKRTVSQQALTVASKTSLKATTNTLTTAAAKTYVVKFYDAYGNVIKTQKVKAGKAAKAPSKKLMKILNRTFKGWSVSFKKVSANLRVHPLYKDKHGFYYLVIDNTNNKRGTSYKSTQIIKAGTRISLKQYKGTSGGSSSLPTVGFNVETNGKTTYYDINQIFTMPKADTLITPVFAKAKSTTKVTYYPGRNYSVSSSTYTKGTQITIGNSSLSTNAGYTLVGYSSKAGGKGKFYALGSTYTTSKRNVSFYGVWKKNTVRLHLVGNFAKGGDVDYYVPANYALPLDSLGYRFSFVASSDDLDSDYYLKAFTTKKNGKGARYVVANAAPSVRNGGANAYVSVPSRGLTLYAQWGKYRTATYKANYKGNTASYSDTYMPGSTTYVSCNLYRDDYDLAGFSTKANGKGKFYPNDSQITAPSKNQTLYAQWIKKTATLTYNANYGKKPSTSSSKVAQNYRSSGYFSFSRDGYVLVGWGSSKKSNGAVYSNGIGNGFEFTPTAKKTTLYAQWAKGAKLTYDRNDGSSNTTYSSNNVKKGSTTTISSYSPTRSGYGLAGWTTNKSGKGKVYHTGDELKVSKNMTLYAKWGKNVTVTFKGNGGKTYSYSTHKYSSSDQKIVGAKGGLLSSYPSEPSRDGYTFIGWSTKKNGKGISYSRSYFSPYSYEYADSSNAYRAKKATFYAQWAKLPKLTIFSNKSAKDSNKITGSSSYYSWLGSNRYAYYLENGKKALAGYNTNRKGKGTSFKVGTRLSSIPASGLKLYSQWKKSTAKVVFSGNGNSTKTTTLYGLKGSFLQVYLPANLSSISEKYYFKDWRTQKKGGKTVSSGLTYLSKNITYYANWGTKTAFTFNANGGKGTTSTQYVGPFEYKNISSISSKFSREHYTLLGWSTKQNATSAEYATYDSMSHTKDGATVNLYAVWGADMQITFNANGGTGSTVVKYLSNYDDLSLSSVSGFSRSGYNLIGWSTNPSASTPEYDTYDWIEFENYGVKKTLYAIWQPEAM